MPDFSTRRPLGFNPGLSLRLRRLPGKLIDEGRRRRAAVAAAELDVLPGLAVIAEREQGGCEVTVRGRIVLLQPEGGPVVLDRFARPPGASQGDPEVVVGLGVVRPDAQRLLVVLDGGRVVSLCGERDGEV